MYPSESIHGIRKISSPKSLDFDPVFLARFPVEELINNRITILHSAKDFDWRSRWEFADKSALWNFNLHYFEYLFPIAKEWLDTGNEKILNKSIEMIEGWIKNNPKGTGPGWAPYTIALRTVIWISYYGYVSEALPEEFKKKFLTSLHDQYVYLTKHLEKDILGNHYFEDLKGIVLCALFFRDEVVLNKALADLKKECREEILSDGMHFELSPMYHKIVFEGMLRVTAALRDAGKGEPEMEAYLQPMLNAAYSFEVGLDRLPLFNDCGNNISKSMRALTNTAEYYFGIKPCFTERFKDSGFFIFEKNVDGNKWKLIVDGGQPGPKYIPGHAHCDAMSYELFRNGKPMAVNCGTYAYQCKERHFFRSTAAHNTVMVNGREQSQCWGTFRVAKRSKTKIISVQDDSITMELTDAQGKRCTRIIKIESGQIHITDESPGETLTVYVHAAEPINLYVSGDKEKTKQPYAPDFGIKQEIDCYQFSGKDKVIHIIDLHKK